MAGKEEKSKNSLGRSTLKQQNVESRGISYIKFTNLQTKSGINVIRDDFPLSFQRKISKNPNAKSIAFRPKAKGFG